MYCSPTVEYGYWELLPAEYWNGQLVNPPTPIGREPKFFCDEVVVYKGCSHANPTKCVVTVRFDKPVELQKLVKEWKANLPKFEEFKGARIIRKKKLGDNIYA
jgi:hypothetical protein